MHGGSAVGCTRIRLRGLYVLFPSRRRHTRFDCDWSSDVCSSDLVWLSDFGANAIVRFEPATEKFQVFPSDKRGANVRQILGRPGEVWAPESGNDRLVVFRTR